MDGILLVLGRCFGGGKILWLHWVGMGKNLPLIVPIGAYVQSPVDRMLRRELESSKARSIQYDVRSIGHVSGFRENWIVGSVW